MNTERQKFIDRINDMIYNRLDSIHFIPPNMTRLEAVEEEIYGKLNKMLEVNDLPDPKVLGKYST